MYLHSWAVHLTQRRRSSLMFVLQAAYSLISHFYFRCLGKENMSDSIDIQENNWWEGSIYELHFRKKQME